MASHSGESWLQAHGF